MYKQNTLKKLTALTLSFMLMFSYCMNGTECYAETAPERISHSAGSKADDPVSSGRHTVEADDAGVIRRKYEIKKERTEASTSWKMSDGSIQTELYADPVRFQKDGELVDYDLSFDKYAADAAYYKCKSGILSDDKYAFMTSASDCISYLPKKLEEGSPVVVSDEEHYLEVSPLCEKGSKTDNGFSAGLSFGSVKSASEKETDLYGQPADKKRTVSYLSGDGSVELTYESFEKGLKECLVLNRKPVTNRWKFRLRPDSSLTVKEDRTTGLISFADPYGNIVGGLQPPEMNDATGGNYSEDITYHIDKDGTDGSYILTMSVSREYLDSERTVYPVTIDPTYAWQGNPDLQDVYVSGKSTYADTNFNTSGTTCMFTGKNNTYGTMRTYIKFKNLASMVSGYSITSAVLTVYEYGGSSSGENVQARRVLGSWTPSGITWNNKPSYGTLVQDSFTTNGVARHKATLDITDYVRRVENGDVDYGIMLKSASETEGNYVKLYGSRHASASYRPKLVINYMNKPSVAEKITLDDKWLSNGEKLGITWKGIVSPSLDIVQYRIASVADDGETAIDTNYVEYSTTRYLGTTRDGSRQLNVSAFPDGWYRINVRGRDTNGEAGPNKYLSFLIDRTSPALSRAVSSPATGPASYSRNARPQISWTASDRFLSRIQYSVDGGSWKTAGTESTGQFSLPEGDITAAGAHTILLRSLDKCGNQSPEKTITYYYDNVQPKGSIAEEQADAAGNRSVISFTASDAASGVASVKLWICSGSDETLLYNGTGGSSVTLSSSIYTDNEYTLKLQVKDGAGNTRTVTKTFRWVSLEDWAVTGIHTSEAVDGKTSLFFMCPAITGNDDVLLPDSVSYQVAETVSPAEIPSADSIVAEGVKGFCWSDIRYAQPGHTARYYRIRPVRTNTEGTVLEYGDWSEPVSAVNETAGAADSVTGISEYMTSFSFDTPVGNGQVELSRGNLYYEQDDLAGEEDGSSLEVTRYYNSLSLYQTALGRGWRHSYDVTLLDKGALTEGPADHLYIMRDADGTEYSFSEVCADDGTGNDQDITIPDSYSTGGTRAYHLGISTGAGSREELDTGKCLTWHYRVTDKSHTVRYFNQSGQLLAVCDPSDEWLYCTYDERTGMLDNVENDSGDRIGFAYQDINGTMRLTAIILADGTELHYEYDPDGYLTGKNRYLSEDEDVISACSYSWTDGYLSCFTDGEGNGYTAEYADGRLSLLTYPNGESEGFVYDADSRHTDVTSYTSTDLAFGTESYSYDIQGRVTEYVDVSGSVESSTYNASGQQSLQTVSREYEYLDGTDIIKDTVYSDHEWYYDIMGNVTLEIENGIETSYEYEDDENENLVTSEICTAADGSILSSLSYSYDHMERIQEESDLITGTRTEYLYETDASGCLSTVTVSEYKGEFLRSKKTELYDEKDQLLREKEESGKLRDSSALSYDDKGNLVRSEKQDGSYTEFGYDATGNLVSQKQFDPSGQKTAEMEAAYGENNEILMSLSDGVNTEYSYDSMNRMTESVTENDRETVYLYGYENITPGFPDSSGQSVLTSHETVRSGNIEYEIWTDASGNTVRELRNGVITDIRYDASGNAYLISSGRETGERILSAVLYDEKGRETETITGIAYDNGIYSMKADCRHTSLVYDASGNLILKKEWLSGDGSIQGEYLLTQYTYDSENRVLSVSTGSQTVSYGYDTDAYGNQICTKDLGDGAGSIEIYDAAGNTLYTKDGTGTEGIGHVYIYDINGNLSYDVITSDPTASGPDEPNSGYVRYVYDENGNLAVCESYDSENVIEQKTAYDHDSRGRTVSMKISNARDEVLIPVRTECYEYDGYDRIVSTTVYEDTTDPSPEDAGFTTGYEYTADGLVSEISYSEHIAGLASVRYTYNGQGQLTALLALLDGMDSPVPAAEYGYDTSGQLISRMFDPDIYGPGQSRISENYGYDEYGRPVSITCRTGEETVSAESHSYNYDRLSRVTQENDLIQWDASLPGYSSERSYSYDGANHLTQSVQDLGSERITTSYTYDSAGNRSRVSRNAGYSSVESTFTYNSCGQVTRAREITGSLTTSDITYSYDRAGNLARSYDSISEEGTEYRYNSLCQLTDVYQETEDSHENLPVQSDVYDGNGFRISKTVDGCSTSYLYQNGTQTVMLNSDGERSVNITDPNGVILFTLAEEEDGNRCYSYHYDVRNSITAVTDENMNCVTWYSYGDFGETEVHNMSARGCCNAHAYTSAVYDEETELYYMNARYYNPYNAQFCSMDTVRGSTDDPNSLYLYRYCNNSPVNYTDPTGHDVMAIGIGVGATFILDVSLIVYYGIDHNGNMALFRTYNVGFSIGPTETPEWGNKIDFLYVTNMTIKDMKGYGFNSGAQLTCGPIDINAGVSVTLSKNDKGVIGMSVSSSFKKSLLVNFSVTVSASHTRLKKTGNLHKLLKKPIGYARKCKIKGQKVSIIKKAKSYLKITFKNKFSFRLNKNKRFSNFKKV